MQPNEPKNPSEEESKKKEGEESKGLYDFAKTNTKDTIAYVILIFGFIMMFFQPFLGELLIGIIAGLYFAYEIETFFKHLNEVLEIQGMVRSIIIVITTLTFLITAPGVFVGIAIAIILKHLFGSSDTLRS